MCVYLNIFTFSGGFGGADYENDIGFPVITNFQKLFEKLEIPDFLGGRVTIKIPKKFELLYFCTHGTEYRLETSRKHVYQVLR